MNQLELSEESMILQSTLLLKQVMDVLREL